MNLFLLRFYIESASKENPYEILLKPKHCLDKQKEKVLDVQAFSFKPGAKIIIYDPNKGNNQVFMLEEKENGLFVIRVKHSNLVLDAKKSWIYYDVVQEKENGLDSQLWKLVQKD